MEKARFYLSILLAFSLGWFAHSLTVGKNPQLNPASMPPTKAIHPKLSTAPTPPPSAERMDNRPAIPVYAIERELKEAEKDPEKSRAEELLNRFTRLLSQHKFEAAITLYQEEGANLPVKEQQSWRAVLIDFLSRRLDNGETALFSELAGLWLQFSYSDIDVILLTAKYNRVMGYTDEALQTYLQAKSYANTTYNQRKVHSELQDFIFTRDSDWSKRGKWYELMQFFAQLEDLGLTNDRQKFRYAELLLMHHDQGLAYLLLEELARINAVWAEQVKALKTQYEQNGEYQVSENNSSFRSSIKLKPRNGHYLVPITINSGHQAKMLLDTGATMTTLTVEKFAQLVRDTGWQDHGWAMFNTANGLTRGRVVQVDELQLGTYVLRDVKLSVLPANLGEGVYGLLGMNVLSQFHFQIDQDNHELLLSPRE